MIWLHWWEVAAVCGAVASSPADWSLLCLSDAHSSFKSSVVLCHTPPSCNCLVPPLTYSRVNALDISCFNARKYLLLLLYLKLLHRGGGATEYKDSFCYSIVHLLRELFFFNFKERRRKKLGVCGGCAYARACSCCCCIFLRCMPHFLLGCTIIISLSHPN